MPTFNPDVINELQHLSPEIRGILAIQRQLSVPELSIVQTRQENTEEMLIDHDETLLKQKNGLTHMRNALLSFSQENEHLQSRLIDVEKRLDAIERALRGTRQARGRAR